LRFYFAKFKLVPSTSSDILMILFFCNILSPTFSLTRFPLSVLVKKLFNLSLSFFSLPWINFFISKVDWKKWEMKRVAGSMLVFFCIEGNIMNAFECYFLMHLSAFFPTFSLLLIMPDFLLQWVKNGMNEKKVKIYNFTFSLLPSVLIIYHIFSLRIWKEWLAVVLYLWINSKINL
jgi:hypothetical protein